MLCDYCQHDIPADGNKCNYCWAPKPKLKAITKPTTRKKKTIIKKNNLLKRIIDIMRFVALSAVLYLIIALGTFHCWINDAFPAPEITDKNNYVYKILEQNYDRIENLRVKRFSGRGRNTEYLFIGIRDNRMSNRHIICNDEKQLCYE